MKSCRLTTIVTISAMTALSGAAIAQGAAGFPSKPVRVVLAQAPGGATDIQARLFMAKMSQNLGQEFIIDNRAGSGVGGLSTYTMVAKGEPDGYTLLAVTPSFTFLPALHKEFTVDPIRDFAPVSLMTRAPYLLVVNPSVPAKSVKEFIALARAQPGKMNFGAGGYGSGTHLITEWFIHAAKIKATYIPYKSTGPARIDLMAGRLQAALNNVLSTIPHLKSGKLRALGISSNKRSKVLPDLPTIAEQGVAGFDAATFHAYVVPARTPVAIINKLSTELAKVVRSTEIAEHLASDGGEPIGSTPNEFKKQIVTEMHLWRNLVKDVGIRIGN